MRQKLVYQKYNMKLSSLHEGLDKSRRQPKAVMNKVWNVDEHTKKGSKKQWYHGKGKPAKPYGWSKTGTFHGQSEGWKEHII